MESFIVEILNPLLIRATAGQTASSITALTGYLTLLQSPFWLTLTTNKKIYELSLGTSHLIDLIQKQYSSKNIRIMHEVFVEKIESFSNEISESQEDFSVGAEGNTFTRFEEESSDINSTSQSSAQISYRIISSGLKKPPVDRYDAVVLASPLNQLPECIHSEMKIPMKRYQKLFVTFISAASLDKKYFKHHSQDKDVLRSDLSLTLLERIERKKYLLELLGKKETDFIREDIFKELSLSTNEKKSMWIYATNPRLPFYSIEVLPQTNGSNNRNIFKVYSKDTLSSDFLCAVFKDIQLETVSSFQMNPSYPIYSSNLNSLRNSSLVFEPLPNVYLPSNVELIQLSIESQLFASLNIAKHLSSKFY